MRPSDVHQLKFRSASQNTPALGGVPSSLLRGALLLAHLFQHIEVVLDVLVRIRIHFAAQTRRQNYPGTVMPKAEYAAFAALDPFFDVVQNGLGGLVDGDHYFDTVAEDAVFKFLYEFPRWLRTIKGRANLMTQYASYGDNIRLHTADKLIVHHAKTGGIVILEYQVHGTVLATGAPYNNKFVSVITVGDRKIIHRRDYMDSLAAWNALTTRSNNVKDRHMN